MNHHLLPIAEIEELFNTNSKGLHSAYSYSLGVLTNGGCVYCYTSLGHAMAIRSDWKSLFIFRTQALTISELFICLGLSSIVFWAVELEKWFKRKKMDSSQGLLNQKA